MDVENVYATKNPHTHQENAGLCISLNFFNILLIGAIESLARNRAIAQSAH